jgi:hypothetical protein
MDYNKIDVDKIVDEVYSTEAKGRKRPMTKQEVMMIRLAALRVIIRNMLETVERTMSLAAPAASNV